MPSGIPAERWVAALAELEHQVLEALHNADAGAEPDVGVRAGLGWQPPVGLGPLPAELVVRARRLAAAQQQAMDRIASDMRSSRKHAAFVAAVPRPGSGVRSIYLDTES